MIRSLIFSIVLFAAVPFALADKAAVPLIGGDNLPVEQFALSGDGRAEVVDLTTSSVVSLAEKDNDICGLDLCTVTTKSDQSGDEAP